MRARARTGCVEAIRAIRIARRSAVKARTQTANQIHALIVTAPTGLRDQVRGWSLPRLVTRFHQTDPTVDPADPGFAVVTPGSGLIMIAPVSVCHQVSTTGVSPRPMFSRYRGRCGHPAAGHRRRQPRPDAR